MQWFHMGAAVDTDDIQIDAIGPFQFGGGKQVGHQGIRIHPVGPGYNHQPGGFFMVGFVP